MKKIFLDVGGHRGQTLEVVLSSKCQFDLVHCFEPIPELYEHIKTTFSADISTGKLLVHNFGLANFTDERKLYGTGQQAHLGDGIGASLFADKCDIDNRHFIKCRFVSASEFMVQHLTSFDLIVVKLNCEGCEVLILRDLIESGKIHDINFILIDFDVVKIPSQQTTKQEILRKLETVSYADFVIASDIGRTMSHRDTTEIWLSLMPCAKDVMTMSLWETLRAKLLVGVSVKMRKWYMRRRKKLYRLLGKPKHD